MVSIPVIVVTGFLGSGKTTLINRLLRDPGMTDTAVVINEFGEVSIDHLLVESAIENTLVLQSGCICCTVRGDLVDTLAGLEEQRDRGQIPGFSRVLVETTGLADPVPIVQTLATDPLLAGRFVLRAIVTTADAVNGSAQLDEFPEPPKQAALADVLILTKTDLAGPEAVIGLEGRLARLNPSARVLRVVAGEIAAAELFAAVGGDPVASGEALERWLAVEPPHGAHGPAHEGHHHGSHDHAHAAHEPAEPSRHGDRIRATALTLEGPVAWDRLERWLQALLSLRGGDILRLKGVVDVEGRPGPVVVQAVQHLLHPPQRLVRWPDGERRTRIVVIARDVPPAALQASLAAAVG